MNMASRSPNTIAGVNIEKDFGYGISTKPAKTPEGDQQPAQSAASRALSLASYFVGGCMAYVSLIIRRGTHMRLKFSQADEILELMHHNFSALRYTSSTKSGTIRG